MSDFDFDGDFDGEEEGLDTDLTDTGPNPELWEDSLQNGSEYPDDEFDRLDDWDDEEYR